MLTSISTNKKLIAVWTEKKYMTKIATDILWELATLYISQGQHLVAKNDQAIMHTINVRAANEKWLA
jgi:hypothetical protein